MQLLLALAAPTILLTHQHGALSVDTNDVANRVLSTDSFSSLPSEIVAAASATGFTTWENSLTEIQDILTIQERRVGNILAVAQHVAQIPSWLQTLGPDGKWPDNEIDYSTGCAARRANWPAQVHWQRLADMSRAWRGLPGGDVYNHNSTLREAISRGMNYWFGRDFKNIACLDSGGLSSCPCDNPDNSLWNTNWFSNLILVPEFVGQTCLLLNDTLADNELDNCTRIADRSYAAFGRKLHGIGALTGANTLDVVKIGIDHGLLTFNVSLLTDAFGSAHEELEIMNETHADGIRADGAFGQHTGLLYNGNYGKDFTNDILDLEIEAAGTAYEASADSKRTLEVLFDGDRWMIFRNIITGILHWDFSVLPRFISFPVIDGQATENIKLNLTEVLDLGDRWSSRALIDFAKNLTSSNATANAGGLVGNRMFYTNDYMVHRGSNYVTTLKMFSTRTKNSECTNLQNPFGFHLADGTLYTHVKGTEYEDISAAWDWNRIPGTTSDYGATPLACNITSHKGAEDFVGGVSDGEVGAAAMRYTNPLTKSLLWQKAWFFLGNDTQLVMVAGLQSATNASVISVLDQKRLEGDIWVDGRIINKSQASNVTSARTLWHNDVGYVLPTDNGSPFKLGLDVGKKQGNWSAVGTSTQPPFTVDLFAAWIEHPSKSLSTPLAYAIFPGITADQFVPKAGSRKLRILQNDEHTSAVYDDDSHVFMAIFWDLSGGSIIIPRGEDQADVLVQTNSSIAFVWKETGDIIVSDPSQLLKFVKISMTIGHGTPPPRWGQIPTKEYDIEMPLGGLAGSSIKRSICDGSQGLASDK